MRHIWMKMLLFLETLPNCLESVIFGTSQNKLDVSVQVVNKWKCPPTNIKKKKKKKYRLFRQSSTITFENIKCKLWKTSSAVNLGRNPNVEKYRTNPPSRHGACPFSSLGQTQTFKQPAIDSSFPSQGRGRKIRYANCINLWLTHGISHTLKI